MRKLILSFVLATAGAVGLTAAEPASAYNDGRIFVSIGDVSFSYGQPYHRHSRAPLYVVHESWGPRYYYTAPTHYYAPPPPRYYAAPRYVAPRVYWGGGYGHHDDRYDRRHDRRDDRYHRREDRRDYRHDRRDDRHDRRGHR